MEAKVGALFPADGEGIKSMLLWLEGPLQSWGASSLFRRRETLDFPTRSGVLGMLACAAGLYGEQKEWCARMAAFRQDVRAYAPRAESGHPRIPPLLEDFQTVGCGWPEASGTWEAMHVPKKLDGTKCAGGTGPKILTKIYLQDVAFACVLELPESDAAFLLNALAHPVRSICLGRRCCAPSDLIPRGCFSTRDEAFAEADRIAQSKNRVVAGDFFEGAFPGAEEAMQINDVPVSFGLHPKYRTRTVTAFR